MRPALTRPLIEWHKHFHHFTIMSENQELLLLKSQLETYIYRTNILYFQSLASRYNSRSQFLLKGSAFHLNDCVWSLNNATCGPDTCHCYLALESPDHYFDSRIQHPSKYMQISKLHLIRKRDLNKDYKPLNLNLEDEHLNDFYQYRVLDSENIHKWYEMYKKKTNVLQFQVKVRELNIASEIDAVFNFESKEWHLTDCIRSVAWDLGPDTCHCQKAVLNPWKYLKERYNYIDAKKTMDRINAKQTPVNFKSKT